MKCFRRALFRNTPLEGLALQRKKNSIESVTVANIVAKLAGDELIGIVIEPFEKLFQRVAEYGFNEKKYKHPLARLYSLLYLKRVKEHFDIGIQAYYKVANIVHIEKSVAESLFFYSFRKKFFGSDLQFLVSMINPPKKQTLEKPPESTFSKSLKARNLFDEAVRKGSKIPLIIAQEYVFNQYYKSEHEIAIRSMAKAINGISTAFENLGIKFRNEKGVEKNDVRKIVKNRLEHIFLYQLGAKFLKDSDKLDEMMNAIHKGNLHKDVREDLIAAIRVSRCKKLLQKTA